jgi:hypothetical protein
VSSTCSLWSTISVDVDTTSTRTANSSLKRLEAHLRRAGTRSLLDLRLFFRTESRRPTTKQILKACELIGGRDMLARWRSLTLIKPPFILSQEQLEPLFAHPLPNLHSLSVGSGCSSGLLDILLKMIDSSSKAFRVLDQWEHTDLTPYPNILKRVEVLRYRDREKYHWPDLLKSISLMRALNEVELPGNIVPHRPEWMGSVRRATFFEVDVFSVNFFNSQKESFRNLRQLSLIRPCGFPIRQLWIKIPNLRVLEVVGDFAIISCFDTPILDDLCLISPTHIWIIVLGSGDEEVLEGLCNHPSWFPKTRHLRLETNASPAHTIEFLKKMPGLERLTIQEHPLLTLSYDLFVALKEVEEEVVHADDSPRRKMAVCPSLQDLTIKTRSTSSPHLSEWVTEVASVRRNSGQTFEGVARRDPELNQPVTTATAHDVLIALAIC